MNTKPFLFFAILIGLTGSLNVAAGASDSSAPSLRAFSDGFADVAEKIKPSVVTVYSEKTIKLPRFQWPFGDNLPFQFFSDPDDDAPRQRHPLPREHQFKQTGMGSGIVLDKDGHILTNNHVVDGTDEIKVKFADGATFDAAIVGTDSRSDLAILKIKGKLPANLTPATLGDSDAQRVGEWVLAVGAPFNFEQTVTAGIISAKGRTQIDGNRDNRDKYEDFIQTDAAINPGNSGGPLVNLRGEVIGINTAITSPVGQNAGVGFAIAVNMAKRIVRELIQSGKVTRGFLGVVIQDLTPDLAAQFKASVTKGAVINQVNKDTPAEKAGLKVGDVIIRLDRKPVDDTRQLRNLVADIEPGRPAELTVIRAGKEQTVTVKVGELDAPGTTASRNGDESADHSKNFGLAVEPLTDRQAHALGFDNETGVLVTAVDNDSPAEAAGIQPGDLILEVNHDRVTNLAEFRTAIGRESGKALLLVKNKEVSRFVVLSAK